MYAITNSQLLVCWSERGIAEIRTLAGEVSW